MALHARDIGSPRGDEAHESGYVRRTIARAVLDLDLTPEEADELHARWQQPVSRPVRRPRAAAKGDTDELRRLTS